MDENGVSFKRKISPIGASLGVTIPKELYEFLGINEGDSVRLCGYNGKHGKYLALWVDEDAKKE